MSEDSSDHLGDRPEQIVPTGEENMAGFVVYSERVLQGWKEGLLPRNATTHAR